MFSQPFRKLGRSVLAASAVSLGVTSLGAQTPAAAPPSGPNPSRVDVFLGYSYWGGHGQLKPAGITYSSVDIGAIGSGAYYFSKYAGFEVSAAFHPDGKNDGLMPLLQAGPIFRLPTNNVTFFGHALAGAARLGGPNSQVPFYHNPYTWGPSLTAGGGMDYNIGSGKFGIRLFQADYVYIHENYGPYVGFPTPGAMGGRANLSTAQLSAGVLMHFGHIIPPPPVTYSCVASPTSVYAGDPITVTGTAMNLNPKKTPTYAWTADAGKVSGNSNVANVDTTGLNPGTYNVKGTVTESQKAGRFADCAAPFTVNPLPPLSLSCSASPSTVQPGGSATVTSSVSDSYGKPVNYTYSYSSTSGSVSGSGTSATLSTAGAAPGTVTITCNVADDKGRNASSTTTVSINEPPKPPAPSTSTLCSVSFDRDKRRPARVDNEGKACLDDVALNLQRNSDAKLALTGNVATSVKKGQKLPSSRAVNAKDYLVKDKGIDASRIMVYTGTSDANTVTTTLIPAGATAGDMGTVVDESAVKAAPAPRARHRRR